MTEERIDVPLSEIGIEPPTIIERNSDTNKYLDPHIYSGLNTELEPHRIKVSTSEMLDGLSAISELNSRVESSYQEALTSRLEEIKEKTRDEEYLKKMEVVLLSHESTHREAEVRTGLAATDSELDSLDTLKTSQKKELNLIRQRIKTYDEVGAIIASVRLNQGELKQTAADINFLTATGILTGYIGENASDFDENVRMLFDSMSKPSGVYMHDVYNFSSHVLASISIAKGDLDYVTKCQTGQITQEDFAADIQQSVEKYVRDPEEAFKSLENEQFFLGCDARLTSSVDQSKKFLT